MEGRMASRPDGWWVGWLVGLAYPVVCSVNLCNASISILRSMSSVAEQISSPGVVVFSAFSSDSVRPCLHFVSFFHSLIIFFILQPMQYPLLWIHHRREERGK